MTFRLPVTDALPDLLDAVRRSGRFVLVAPPGAGKTTGVPLALLSDGTIKGRIVLLEPRRIAARAAAERMAATLGEAVGETCGFRIRGDALVSSRTRIEVVTEGILTRMIQSDPELAGIGAVLFDEFHERSIHADLGLALAWDVRQALRPDLCLGVMSATMDPTGVAGLLDGAPVVRSEGRAFPVETKWLDRPLGRDRRFEDAAAGLVLHALDDTTEGSLLAFLPGEREIAGVAARLDGRLPSDCDIKRLFGTLGADAQRAALAPPGPGRRNVVLATSIAETSLTLPDIRIVVDAGLARRSVFDPSSGMARLVTERVTRAEADQRRGRAGRVAPGTCYRMWARAEEGALAALPPPEIQRSDLTRLALELAIWGSDGRDLAFLTPPPAPAMAEARDLLTSLGALGADGLVTAEGRRIASVPVHPRLARMLLTAGPDAAKLAALLEDRDPLRGASSALSPGADVEARLAALRNGSGMDPRVRERILSEASRLSKLAHQSCTSMSPGEMLALAYPDRVALRRPVEGSTLHLRYALSGGKGAAIPSGDPLSRSEMLVVADLDGDPRESRIRLAAAIGKAEVLRLFAPQIVRSEVIEWSRRENRVVARLQERLGALVLSDSPLPRPDPERAARAALDGLRATGLIMGEAARRYRARVEFLRRDGADLPDCGDAALLSDDASLLPHVWSCRTADDLRSVDFLAVIRDRLGPLAASVEKLAPAGFATPLGRIVPVDYEGDAPAIEVRLQELFGVTVHPVVGPSRLPLRITLLSPAGRPVQVTTDLPRFWSTSYADVRKDMRGRYPKHPWPDDPTQAAPTLRAKPRAG